MVRVAAFVLPLAIVGDLSAAPTAKLDKTESLESQTVTLTVTYEGRSDRIDPDWTVLDQSFDHYVTNTISSMQYINGRLGSYTRWEVQLRPKTVGELVVPPISVGAEKTQALTLRVKPLDQSLKQELFKNAFIEVTVSHEEQYVQAAIRVTRKLYNASGVRYSGIRSNFGILPLLDIENARVVPFESGTVQSTIHQGKLFAVTTQEFLIFGQKSGELILPAISITAHFPRTAGRPAVALQIGHAEKVLKILPIPTEYPANTPWLPASSIELSQQLIPESPGTLSIGDSFVRTIRVTGTDTLASGIPDLETIVGDGISVYSEPPSHEDTVDERGVVGTRTQTETFIVRQKGNYEIDPTEIIWWDTKQHQLRKSTLAGFNIEVNGDTAAPVQVSQSIETQTPVVVEAPNDPVGSRTILKESATDTAILSSNRLLFWIPVSSGWVVAILLLILLLAQRRGSSKGSRTEARIEQSKRKLRSNDPQEVKKAMVAWVMHQNDVSRAAASQLILGHEYLRNIFRKLNAVLYGDREERIDYDVGKIVTSLSSLKPNLDEKRDSSMLLEYYT